MNTRKPTQKILSAVLSATLLCGCATGGVAAVSPSAEPILDATISATRFSDVSTGHWGYEDIETLAQGGLINGYGDGVFGPDDILSIAQMATIICNVKGVNAGAQNGYWGYDAVDYCISIRCLPDFGDITAQVYDAGCTRELAVYMMVKGLGSAGVTETNYSLNWTAVPDNYKISTAYRSKILEAYQTGIVSGIDEKCTFDPLTELTRASLCAMLCRAGFTTGAEKPDDVPATGMTGDEIYDVVASWGWREWDPGSYKTLTATDPLLGGMQLTLRANGLMSISMKEINYDGFSINGVSSDRYGTPRSTLNLHGDGVNEEGVFVMSSAWCYEARQAVKEILKMAYPVSYEEAYQAMMDVMGQEDIYEDVNSIYPSAQRWMDGRVFTVNLDQSQNAAIVYIGAKDDEDYYNSSVSSPAVGVRRIYVSDHGSLEDIPTLYEFYKG